MPRASPHAIPATTCPPARGRAPGRSDADSDSSHTASAGAETASRSPLPGPRLAAAITGKHADALIFTVPNGSPLRLSNWRRAVFLPACTRAGISARFRVHDLRHTAASLMFQAGYPPKMLQEIMGHASITTTLDLYGHLYPGDMDRYADRLDDAAEDAGTARIRPDDENEDEDRS
jgi:Phage integrase family